MQEVIFIIELKNPIYELLHYEKAFNQLKTASKSSKKGNEWW
jgi:hypothetical protein